MNNKIMNYNEYIQSDLWKEKRNKRLILDNNHCRLCDEDGTYYQLEVHHRPSSYKKIPNESIEDDLITICSRCHDLITDAIRKDRNKNKKYKEPKPLKSKIEKREDNNHGLGNSDLQINIIGPIDNAQREDGRSIERIYESIKGNFVKKEENRRGL
jgi:hypothetical protein